MNFYIDNKMLLAAVFTAFFGLNSFSQDIKISVEQDPKFEKLLNEKRRIFVGTVADDYFKIQIFNGTTDDAKKTLIAFRKEFSDLESTIVFNTPNYRVVVGNFKNRIEAERILQEVRKSYKNALLIRPKR